MNTTENNESKNDNTIVMMPISQCREWYADLDQHAKDHYKRMYSILVDDTILCDHDNDPLVTIEMTKDEHRKWYSSLVGA